MKSLALMALVVAPTSFHSLRAASPTAAPVPAPAPALAEPVLGGAPVPGVCLLSRPAVFAQAKVGEAATQRLRQLVQQADAEIAAERQPIEVERKAYQADKTKLSLVQQQQREQAIAAHLHALEQKAQLRTRELELTREKAQMRIAGEMRPMLQQLYKDRGCGLLLDRASVIGGNMANDLTPAVIHDLDAKISTISFERETIATTAHTDVPSPTRSSQP